jgi:hypothetical protein
MIKLDPEDEVEDDDDENKVKQSAVASQKQSTIQSGNSTYVAVDEDMLMNNVVMNNVQINLTRVNLPPEYQSYVSIAQNFI